MAENDKPTNLEERLMQAEANRAEAMQRRLEEKQTFVNQLKALTTDQRADLLRMVMRDKDGAKILSDNLNEADEFVDDPELADLISQIRKQAAFSSATSRAKRSDQERKGAPSTMYLSDGSDFEMDDQSD